MSRFCSHKRRKTFFKSHVVLHYQKKSRSHSGMYKYSSDHWKKINISLKYIWSQTPKVIKVHPKNLYIVVTVVFSMFCRQIFLRNWWAMDWWIYTNGNTEMHERNKDQKVVWKCFAETMIEKEFLLACYSKLQNMAKEDKFRAYLNHVVRKEPAV